MEGESVAEHKGDLLDHGAIEEAETQEHNTDEALEEVAENAEAHAAEETGEAPEGEGDAEGAEEGVEADEGAGEEAGEGGEEAEAPEGEAVEGEVQEAAGEEEEEKTMEDEVKAIFGDSDEEDADDQANQENASEGEGEEEEEHIEESTRKLKRLVKQRSRKRTGSDDDEEAPPADEEEEEQTPKKKKKRLSKKKRNAIENDEEGEGDGEEKKKKKRKKKKKAEGEEGAEGGEGGEVADDPNDEEEAPRRRKHEEEFEEFDAAMARLKHKRIKKDLTAEEETKLTESVNNFIIRMEAAADLDDEANRSKQPATNKVAMLTQVVSNLQKTRFGDAFVNQGGLSAVRKWLSPLPDKSLPGLNIREQILTVLDVLPFNRELLQNSEVGKVIMFLCKSPKENAKNKRMCAKIIEKWSRPIFGLNTAYRERDSRGDEDELDRPSRRVKIDDGETEIDKRTREQMKDNRKFHARIPQRIFMDFKKQPMADVKQAPVAKNPHVAAAEADKKIKQKRRAKPVSSSGRVMRAERISVEGRMVK